jgi:hypothetical protein
VCCAPSGLALAVRLVKKKVEGYALDFLVKLVQLVVEAFLVNHIGFPLSRE